MLASRLQFRLWPTRIWLLCVSAGISFGVACLHLLVHACICIAAFPTEPNNMLVILTLDRWRLTGMQEAGAPGGAKSNPNDFLARLRSKPKGPSLSAEQKAAFLQGRDDSAAGDGADGEEPYVGTTMERALGVDYGRK